MKSCKPKGARIYTLSIIPAVAAAFVLVSGVNGVHTDDDMPPGDPRFGVVETYHQPETADDLGIGWSRIIFYWSEIERDGPDGWNEFHAPMGRIDREIEGGREVVGMLVHTPAWATDGVPGAGVPRGLYLAVDDPRNVWASFIRDVVSTYRGRVDRWIIWNEPDIALDVYGAQWQGTVEDYYQLVKVAYLAAHEVNPDVQIHLGALTYWHDPDYLNAFLAVASADPTAGEYGYYFDVVSTHIYFRPETTRDIVGTIRETLQAYGLDKPIWINETNAPPYDDPTHPWNEPLFPVTQEMQGAFLLQEFALALVEGVDRIAVYKWIDQPPPLPGHDAYGLMRPDGYPRPAFSAFEAIMRHYAGTTNATSAQQPEMLLVVLSRGEHVTRVVWARTSDDVIVLLPALAASGLRVEQSGVERSVRPIVGYYLFFLEGAACPPDYGCFMGGPTVLVVEENSASLLADGRGLQNYSVTMRTLTRYGLLGVGLSLGALTGGLTVRRLRRRTGRT